jgi:hypothetical protein
MQAEIQTRLAGVYPHELGGCDLIVGVNGVTIA